MSLRYTDREMRILEKLEITCRDVERLFGEHVDGDLPITLADRLCAHIECCEECREFEAQYRLLLDLARELRQRDEQPLDAGVRTRLRDALKQRGIPLR